MSGGTQFAAYSSGELEYKELIRKLQGMRLMSVIRMSRFAFRLSSFVTLFLNIIQTAGMPVGQS